jgi:hypothetical protein
LLAPANSTVIAEITPSDGESVGETFTTLSITVASSVPIVSEVQIIPVAPFKNNKLILSWKYISKDKLQDQSTTAWFRNGSRIAELDGVKEVPANLLVPKHSWYAIVTPSDGVTQGTPIKSNVVIVQF